MNQEELIDSTFDKIIEEGFNPKTSPLKDKVVIMVTTAQGIIDNGGFEYFFESEFEGNPDLQCFVTVFNEIGAIESTKAIEKALELQNVEGINKFDPLDDIIHENSESNFKKLAKYIENTFV